MACVERRRWPWRWRRPARGWTWRCSGSLLWAPRGAGCGIWPRRDGGSCEVLLDLVYQPGDGGVVCDIGAQEVEVFGDRRALAHAGPAQDLLTVGVPGHFARRRGLLAAPGFGQG